MLKEFGEINLRKAGGDNKAARLYALSLSLSIAIQNGFFAILYIAAGELYAWKPEYKYCQNDVMFIAMFVFIFGVFTAAQASAMGPDGGKALTAGTRIFSVIERPSKIDVMDDKFSKNKKAVPANFFRGEIEFKDVWFRYPTRLQNWVFKGLNLKINANDNIAIVGESGQGKSTFINLVMRFYDPEFGTVLIDGCDVKEMNVVELRQRLGLVMQEPTLFNYTILENILYGCGDASND